MPRDIDADRAVLSQHQQQQLGAAGADDCAAEVVEGEEVDGQRAQRLRPRDGSMSGIELG